METVFALLAGLFLAAALYLILSRALLRIVIGLVLLGNGVNLLIFVAGRLTRATPAIVPAGGTLPAPFANPLPQALILTAIVIGFALFAFLVVLALRAYQVLDADDTSRMRLTEPDDPLPSRQLDY
jgi:multicomponent Na+:H+ antiporter subunit C